jgi:hypothetical protein
MAIVRVDCCASDFAVRLGRNCSSSITASTLSRVLVATSFELLRTRETVEMATPAWSATS